MHDPQLKLDIGLCIENIAVEGTHTVSQNFNIGPDLRSLLVF